MCYRYSQSANWRACRCRRMDKGLEVWNNAEMMRPRPAPARRPIIAARDADFANSDRQSGADGGWVHGSLNKVLAVAASEVSTSNSRMAYALCTVRRNLGLHRSLGISPQCFGKPCIILCTSEGFCQKTWLARPPRPRLPELRTRALSGDSFLNLVSNLASRFEVNFGSGGSALLFVRCQRDEEKQEERGPPRHGHCQLERQR